MTDDVSGVFEKKMLPDPLHMYIPLARKHPHLFAPYTSEQINADISGSAPVVNLICSTLSAGINPTHAIALIGITASQYVSYKNQSALFDPSLPGQNNAQVRQVLRQNIVRSAQAQKLAAATAIPMLSYDAYRLARHIGNSGADLVATSASLAFTLAVGTAIIANAVRASKVQRKFSQSLARA